MILSNTEIAPFDNHTKKQKISILSFPHEILVKIFSSIPTADLIQNVSRVSREFYNLTKDFSAHKYVTLKDFPRHAHGFLDKNNQIQILNLTTKRDSAQAKEFDDQLLKAIAGQQKLRVLNIESMCTSEKIFTCLLKNPNFRFLEKLKIANYHNKANGELNPNWIFTKNLKHLFFFFF